MDSTPDTLTLAEAAELLGVSVAFAQQLVDRDLLGPVDSSGRLAQVEVLAYEQRREERLTAVAEVTEADGASGVPHL
jgi:hypothetical protein